MKKRGNLGYCNKPDRDVPGIVCGYPLPCPYHTLVLEEDQALKLLKQLERRDQVDGDPDGAGEEGS